jgi:hypothetical protein
MKLKSVRLLSAALLAITAAACQKSSPASPSESASTPAAALAEGAVVRDASTGITVLAPALTSPTAGQTFKFTDQPLTLTTKNAVHTGTAATTYLFEVATDSGFANKVYSKDGIAEGTNGSTAQQITTLAGPAAKSYFWHARATVGTVVGPFSAARGFNVGPQEIIAAPTVSSPAGGATLGNNGLLSVNNATVTGTVGGTLGYRFDVSDTSSFSNIVFSGTQNQGSGQTTITMSAKLNANATYYWRVMVTDSSTAVTSPFMTTSTFVFVPFQMTDATVVGSPTDLGSWPQTANVTSVQFQGGGPFGVDFDRRDGPNRWGDTPFGDGSLQYTLGMCLFINNHWYCSAVVQFWYGRSLDSSGNASDVGFEWFYDPVRWGAMTGYQPSPGENVGLFVASGNLRNTSYNQATCPTFCERSNVAFVPWEGNGLGPAIFRFKR